MAGTQAKNLQDPIISTLNQLIHKLFIMIILHIYCNVNRSCFGHP